MKFTCQSNGKLVWQGLLSPGEIKDWANSRKQPRKSWRTDGNSQSGVYRFIFPDDRSCYIGVAGHFGIRLRAHICPRSSRQSNDSKKTASGRSVRGAIQKSLGKCYLECLKIEGTVEICGVKIIQDNFEDFPVRFLLENWAILHSERVEKWHPLNRGIPTGIQQGTKDFFRPAEGNTFQVDPHGKIRQRGGLETLL